IGMEAPTRTTVVMIQYAPYGTSLMGEAGTSMTSPASSVMSLSLPLVMEFTFTSIFFFVPPRSVLHRVTDDRSAGNNAPPAALTPPKAVMPGEMSYAPGVFTQPSTRNRPRLTTMASPPTTGRVRGLSWGEAYSSFRSIATGSRFGFVDAGRTRG